MMYDELEFEGILVEIKKKNLGGHFSGKNLGGHFRCKARFSL
jgi:hypothetical protein